ncbi:hypothetical protein [Pseudomonas sp. AM8]|uniref:hypothetical protein n=1 Tax=Pseudomonas sp. AM8 TaxID=2983368 RepID=UPI002E800E0C|nr:hypothetical protein [Pseudomonas sp. AM8]
MITLKSVRFGLVSAAFLSSISLSAVSGERCPNGFTDLGEAYQEATARFQEAKVQAIATTVKFPKNFLLDTSYVQHSGRWSGGSADAVMSDADVPNGLLIIASGTEGGGKGWSVHKPELRVLEESNNMIVQRGYEMKLYCHTGSGVPDIGPHNSCNVQAIFCGKPKAKSI